MPRRRVSYYYDRQSRTTPFKRWLMIVAADVGSYSYGLGHPMKPLRMRITHELLTAYDMLNKMDVLVSIFLCSTPFFEDSDREQSVQLLKQ